MLKVSQPFILFTKLTLVAVLFTTLCRVVFFLLNPNYFEAVDLWLFYNGMRFDLISIAFTLSPAYLLLLYPYSVIPQLVLKFIRFYASIVLGIFTALNFIDVIYYRFTLKRTTWDIISYLGAGDDFAMLLPQFIVDFWYMILLFFMFIGVIYFSLNRLIAVKKETHSARTKYFSIVLMLSILAIALRGGTQLKPLNIIDASRYTTSQNTALLLSTPFTLMKSMGKDQLTKYAFMDDEKARAYFNPHFEINDGIEQKKNVVVIIMESLSKEYIGYFNPTFNYTPFLDSLMGHSIVFTNAYANGKRSIEALPAIFSSLPNLMNEAFNTSPYAGNKLSSLAEILKSKGYSSSFFHGGANGTMGFDSYTKLAGFDAYYGMDEYPFEDDYDGLWGIFDEAYFRYVAQKQSKFKEPFLSSFFSLSAHHPYTLPANYSSDCPKGELDILPLICYSDNALKNYFDQARKNGWYENSIFIITADHTAQSMSQEYGTTMGIYSIPIILFDPEKSKGIEIEKTTQQADISPTILDYLNLQSSAIFFGQSALDSSSKGFALNYLNDTYQFIDDTYCIKFDGNEINDVYMYKDDKLLNHNLAGQKQSPALMEAQTKMKAIVQTYNYSLIENKLTGND